MEKGHIVNNKWIKLVPIVFIITLVLAGIFSGQQNDLESNKHLDFWGTVVIGDITLYDVLILLLLGFISGIVGGMLGMGGGVLKVANLHLIMGFEMSFARVVSLLSYFIISSSAFVKYKKYNLILWDIAKMLIPSAILGALLGGVIGNFFDKKFIELLLGIYALFAGIIVLNQIWVRPSEKEITEIPREEISETAVSGIGITMGVVSSMIGISGGIISTPMQQTILKLPMKNSIANTITAAIFCSLTASAFLLITGINNGDFSLSHVLFAVVCLIPGNFIGGLCGSFLTKRLHINIIRIIFAITAFIIGFKILSEQFILAG